MTVRQTAEMNLKLVLSIVAVVSMVFGGGGSWMALRMSIQAISAQQAEIVERADAHLRDSDKHMSFETKVATFVSREEFNILRAELRDSDVRQRAILSALARIEAQLEHK